MYACSPQWKADWLSVEDAKKILIKLAKKIKPAPNGPESVGINHGLHFTGGEPFLNFELLIKLVEMAAELRIPSTFVETNGFWCKDDRTTRYRLLRLKNAGLKGLLVSVNPFIIEEVPFERTERAVRIGNELFGKALIVYQEFFFNLFRRLRIKGVLSFQEFLKRQGESLNYVELIPMGRAVHELGYLFRKYPAEEFFGESCREELGRPWHVHIDNYGNYMTGYCGGISLGDAQSLEFGCQEIKLDEYPIIEAVASDIQDFYTLGKEKFGYEDKEDGYISKCHLCLDLRRHIVQQTDSFKELRPREFYFHFDK